MKREVMIVTPGKMYAAELEVDSAEQRTFDFIMNPPRKVALREDDQNLFIGKNFLPLKNAVVYIPRPNGYLEFKRLPNLNIDKSNIVFFFDRFDKLGRESDRLRQDKFKKNLAGQKKLQLFTKVKCNAFFQINGVYQGLPADLFNHAFVALTQVEIMEIRAGEGAQAHDPYSFIGLNPQFIESYVATLAD